MTGELRRGVVRPSGGPDWYRVDDVIMLARRERALWLRSVVRNGAARVGATRLGVLLRGWHERRRGRAEVEDLLILDDRALADIGLRREELWSVHHGRVTLQQLLAGRDEGAELLAFPKRPGAPVGPAGLQHAA